MNLSVAKFEQAQDALLQSSWAHDPGLVAPFIHNIKLTAICRPYTCRLTARLVATLNEVVPWQFNFKARLMTQIFNRFASRAYTPLRGAMCKFCSILSLRTFPPRPGCLHSQPLSRIASSNSRRSH
jgi:hypothetical protein